MAEFVEFRAEEWVGELEQMERLRLFEPNEIKSIATKRKEFEYKIQRRTKCKEDYLKYIQFEIDLHRIIKARRKKTGIKGQKGEIDYSQTHRIGNLFKQVIFRFQDDVKLWMSFFKFCKEVKYQSLVSQMLVRMLQFHSNKPDLWVFAAKWEFTQCKSVTNARQFLTRGLRHHPSSEVLYQELFKLELENTRLKDRELKKKKYEDYELDEVTRNIVEAKVAEVIYDTSIQIMKGVPEFKHTMYNIAVSRQAPVPLREKIFRDIVKNHINEEITWDTIARREMKGLECDLSKLNPEGIEQLNIDVIEKRENTSLRERIQRSINVYEEAVKRIDTMKMWNYYLDFVIELNQNPNSLPVFKKNLLNTAMEGAMNAGKLTEKYYLEWIGKLQKCGNKSKKLEEVLKKATETHTHSVQCWYSYVRFYLLKDLEEDGMKVFEEAVKNIPEAAPLWILVVKYLTQKSSPKVEEILQRGIKSGGEVAQSLKPLYLEWVNKEKGIEETRKIFQSPEMNLCPCLPFYRKMAELESSVDEIRKCHELACDKFGQNDSDVWIEYVKFEMTKGDASKVTQIHRKALSCLTPDKAEEFISEFNNFKIETS